ncbi:MAG: hypothetical protein EBT98_08775, partial [Opitutaceae bacterium]|nr:hypothetical protein [Opitutaceae bacterium]
MTDSTRTPVGFPPTHPLEWEKIAFDVARNQVGPRLPVEQLIYDLGLTPFEFESLCEDQLFRRRVREFAKELTENGSSFVLKAQVQAEELLRTQFRIAKSPDTPPSVAIAAIANTVRWAGLDKRPGDAPTTPAAGVRRSASTSTWGPTP